MNDGSSINTDLEMNGGTVIKPWLSGGLIAALVSMAILSGILILGLRDFENTKRYALEVAAALQKARSEMSTLQAKIDSLKTQKETLAPIVVDWEKRLKEKADAEAFLVTWESKRRQMEADISQADKRLEDANKNIEGTAKQKAELTSDIEKLKAERLSLIKVNTDAEATLRRAQEAERRLNEAQSAIPNTDTRRKQLEADVAAAQEHFDQIQKEADDTRKVREKLVAELAVLRQQSQTLKDEQTALEEKVSGLKASQAATQQEEQKLAKLQLQVAGAEARLNEIEEGQRRMASEREQLTGRLEQIRKDVADLEPHRDTAKADFQKADSDLSVARKLFQEVSVKQDDLVRESSRLEAVIEQLKKEKDALQKEIGGIEGQRPKSPADR